MGVLNVRGRCCVGKRGGGVNTGARKLNNQQSAPSGCFSSSKIGVVSQTKEKKDADSGYPSAASLPLTQPYPGGNPPASRRAWWMIKYTSKLQLWSRPPSPAVC